MTKKNKNSTTLETTRKTHSIIATIYWIIVCLQSARIMTTPSHVMKKWSLNLKDIARETQGTDPLQGGTNGDTSHIAADYVGTNMNNTEEQTQVTMELPDEERNQVTVGSSLDTNSNEEEMIDSTVNEVMPPKTHMTDVLNTKNNTLAQQGNTGAPNTPTFTRGNEDLRDELDTLSTPSKTAVRSSEHSESQSMETTTKAIQPGDTEWLNILKLNNTISKLKEEKTKKGLSAGKEYELANLTNKLHEETAALADKNEGNCENLIKIPEEHKDKYKDTLDYIKEEYKNIYRKERWDPQLADNLITDLPQAQVTLIM
ncbi:25279_t:CDS:2 [Gigaspora rosea]|nr:25279_t:CDS:2 [Gigaspora rosea]